MCSYPRTRRGIQSLPGFRQRFEERQDHNRAIPSLIRDASDHSFIFIVDQGAFSHPENPILVVDLYAECSRTFRVMPSEMWGVENNLSIANLEFDEFVDAADPDGVFRDFSQI